MALYLGNSFIQNIAVGSGNNGVDTTDATATASDMLKGATAYVNDQKITGTIETVQVATPEITFDENGVITSTVNQSGGYTPGGSRSATRQLSVENGKTIIPSKSEQVAISQGKFAKGDIKVAQIPDEYQDVSGVTATAGDVLGGKVIVNADGNSVTGTMPNNGKVTKTLSSKTEIYTVPKGYHDGTGTVSISSDYAEGGWITGETTATITRASYTDCYHTITLCTGVPFEPDYFMISDENIGNEAYGLSSCTYDKLADKVLYDATDLKIKNAGYQQSVPVLTMYSPSSGVPYYRWMWTNSQNNATEGIFYPQFAYENGTVTVRFCADGGIAYNVPSVTCDATFKWAVGKRM